MPRPELGTTYARLPIAAEYEMRRIFLQWGYDNREDVQVRLEPDGESIYLSVTRDEGKTVESATIPFERFLEIVRFGIREAD